MSTNEHMNRQEHAELVRDARALIAAMERGVRRAGAVFATASALTVAAMLADLRPVASVTALVAVLAFMGALVAVCGRITLGDAPAPLDEAATDVARSDPRGSDAAPGTGSNR